MKKDKNEVGKNNHTTHSLCLLYLTDNRIMDPNKFHRFVQKVQFFSPKSHHLKFSDRNQSISTQSQINESLMALMVATDGGAIMKKANNYGWKVISLTTVW